MSLPVKPPPYLRKETEDFRAMADLVIRVPNPPSPLGLDVDAAMQPADGEAPGGSGQDGKQQGEQGPGPSQPKKQKKAAAPQQQAQQAQQAQQQAQQAQQEQAEQAAPSEPKVLLKAHSQVLGRMSSVVAGMLASFSATPTGAACCPASPLDVSTLFAGTPLYSVLLFLGCAYRPEEARTQLELAFEEDMDDIEDGSQQELGVTLGMLRLSHRLDASRLLAAGLDLAEEKSMYRAGARQWLQLAADLQLDELRARVMVWLVRTLGQGYAASAAVAAALKDLGDLATLPPDTAPMLLDGFAAWHCGHQPELEDFVQWTGPGSLCAQMAEQRAADEKHAAAAGMQWDDAFEAQHQQAAADWEAQFGEDPPPGGWDSDDDAPPQDPMHSDDEFGSDEEGSEEGNSEEEEEAEGEGQEGEGEEGSSEEGSSSEESGSSEEESESDSESDNDGGQQGGGQAAAAAGGGQQQQQQEVEEIVLSSPSR